MQFHIIRRRWFRRWRIRLSNLHTPLDALAVFGVRRVMTDDILLVRLDALGDFVLWLPMARTLRQFYFGRKLILLANSQWADLARGLPYWDEVWPVDVKRSN